MSTITKFIFIAALLLSIVVPTAAFLIGEKNRGRFKTTLGINCFLFFGTMALAVIMIFTGDGSVALANAASSALGAISEDGSIFGKSMIFVAMAEGIALYGLIISFMILGKL